LSPVDTEWEHTVRSGKHRRGEHCAEADEGAGEDRRYEQAQCVKPRFLCANALGLAGDFNREQRIKALHGFSS